MRGGVEFPHQFYRFIYHVEFIHLVLNLSNHNTGTLASTTDFQPLHFFNCFTEFLEYTCYMFNSTTKTTVVTSSHDGSFSHEQNFTRARESALQSIRRKLRSHGVKTDTLIQKCEEIDRNGDGSIHPDDLIDIINESVPKNILSKRELRHLTASLCKGGAFTNLEYTKLVDLLDDKPKQKRNLEEEKWRDDEIDAGMERGWATQPGTLGEWVLKAACPSEQKNYVRFIKCLEKFERDSGMRVITTDNGFVVPLGPDLRATIKMHI